MSGRVKRLFDTLEHRFWQLIGVLLVAFALGTFLWFRNDPSVQYFKQYDMDGNPGLSSLPMWQFDLAPGEELKFPIDIPARAPDGRWFLEILGHPVNARTSGKLDIGAASIDVAPSRGPRWHRVYLEWAPMSGERIFAVKYWPGSRAERNGKFRIWGRSAKEGKSPKLLTKGVLWKTLGFFPVPLPLRFRNIESDHSKRWHHLCTHLIPTPFFRAGVQAGPVGSKQMGSALVGVSAGLIALLLLARFAAFTIRHPALGLGVLATTSAATWLRLRHLATFTDLAELTGNDFRIRDWVIWDTANYFSAAFRIYCNEGGDLLHWPVGMPTFSAYLFQWTGVDLGVPKIGFAVLQALVGPLLFFACLPAVKNKLLAFLPLVAWSVFFRPMKYAYYFMTETLAMCLLIAWIAILFSRDPGKRDRQWPWIVLSTGILFGLASYSRDVIVTFLPVYLGMVAVFLGSTWRERLVSTALALVTVVAMWSATPLLFANKNLASGLTALPPVTSYHYHSPSRRIAAEDDEPEEDVLEEHVSEEDEFEEDEGGKEPTAGSHAPRLPGAFSRVATELSSRPIGYLGDLFEAGTRFWHSKYRWNRRLNQEAAPREAYIASLVESELRRGGTYGVILLALVGTAVFGLFFSRRWLALAGFFLYVTAFHVLLFPNFTSRAKAIFFPVVLLFACAGIFALVEGFVPWVRAKLAARSPGPRPG